MTTCNRYEDEEIYSLDDTIKRDKHFDECEDCLSSQKKYDSLKQLMGNISVSDQPSSNWKETVLNEIDQGKRKGLSFKNHFAVAASLLFACTILIFNYSTTTSPLSLDISLKEANSLLRGETITLGSTLEISANTDRSEKFIELRLYRTDGKLIFSCSDAIPCQRQEKSIFAQTEMTELGTYRALVLRSDSQIPTATDSFDSDVIEARKGNITMKVSDEIIVR